VLNTQPAGDLRAAIVKVLASDDSQVSEVFEKVSVPLTGHQGGDDNPEDTLDLLSVIADEAPKTTNLLARASVDLHGGRDAFDRRLDT
jgi:hypothetical protein